MIRMAFVLVPVLMAFFLTFLMAPLLDAMEKRPYSLKGLADDDPVNDTKPDPELAEGEEAPDKEEDERTLDQIVDEEPYTDGATAFNETFQATLMCSDKFVDEKRAKIVRRMNATKHHGLNADDAQLSFIDLTLMGKVPHGIACLLTLLLSVLILVSIVMVSPSPPLPPSSVNSTTPVA